MEEAESLDDRPATERPFGTETVLLVEDEPAVRKLAQKILTRHGYTVMAVGSGGEALATARAHRGRIDLLLTDVVMPGMNGRELHDALKKLRPEVRVLFMSGYAASIIAQHGVLDRHTAFLQKPFTVESLTLKVRQMLDG
jgi:CheY-like chemotaxis protein